MTTSTKIYTFLTSFKKLSAYCPKLLKNQKHAPLKKLWYNNMNISIQYTNQVWNFISGRVIFPGRRFQSSLRFAKGLEIHRTQTSIWFGFRPSQWSDHQMGKSDQKVLPQWVWLSSGIQMANVGYVFGSNVNIVFLYVCLDSCNHKLLKNLAATDHKTKTFFL